MRLSTDVQDQPSGRSEIASSTDDPEGDDFYTDILCPLGRQYALMNSHATFGLRHDGCNKLATFAGSDPAWKKWGPSNPTSAHWYTAQQLSTLIAAYVARTHESGPQRTVREFVAEFAGLSGSAKQKAVTDAVGLTGARLTDLVRNDTQLDAEQIAALLAAMRDASRPVPPATLGLLGREHCAAQLVTLWQVAPTSVRYKRVVGDVDGVPFVVEAAFGVRHERERVLVVGCNFSPLLDPDDAADAIAYPLHSARIDPHDPVVVLVHLATPQPPFTEHGKRALAFGPGDPRADAMGAAVRQVIPKSWKQAKRRADRKDRLLVRDLDRLARAARPTVSLKDAAYSAMEAAYLKASADGTLPANARQIMYAARPLVLAATDGECWRDSAYFTQTLLPGFLEDYPDKTSTWDVAYDARGHAAEPHTGTRTDLGTLEVRAYIASWKAARDDEAMGIREAFPTRGPQYRYRHVLFVEKEGFNALFDRVRLAERFDLGIMSTKGMSVTAARTLVEALSDEGVTILVLHDFDKSGFSILHTLRADTRRYTFRSTPDVVDLGLRLTDVETLGLEGEPVTYPGGIDPRIKLRECGATEAECDFLVRDGRNGQRVELNAMTSLQLVDWLERKLLEHGVTKLVPERDVLATAYQRARRLATIQHAIDTAMAEQARKMYRVPADLSKRIRARLAKNPTLAWDDAVWALAQSGAER